MSELHAHHLGMNFHLANFNPLGLKLVKALQVLSLTASYETRHL